jgi:signal transduction histidine kinase
MTLSRPASYTLLQYSGWGLLYVLMSLLIYNRQISVATELLYCAVLVGSTALGSHLLRNLYRRKLQQAGVVGQATSLLIGSFLIAAVATTLLVIVFFLMSYTEYSFPIPEAQRWFVVNHIFFSGNFLNMLWAMLLWSALYFAITKVRQLRQTTALLQATQLDALLNQLQPHFLFNALNNIRALILEDPEKARDMLSILADMLRYNLDPKAGVKVPLVQELEVVQHYLALCSIQFERRLRYQQQIPEHCLSLVVPRLLLQLCVENAIKHGISHLPAGGSIEISARIVDEQLCLTVSNDGQLRQLTDSTGVGLANIRQRLALLYQGKASLTLSQQAQQVITEIRLPMELANESTAG